MVEGEKDFIEEYDEGPMARRVGALPPGMAAVDASIAECVEDALSVGHTDETLIKLLEEAARLGPSAQASIEGAPPFSVGFAEAMSTSGVPDLLGSAGHAAAQSGGLVMHGADANIRLLQGQPPKDTAAVPGKCGSGAGSDVAFADFMSAFRKEMQGSHDK